MLEKIGRALRSVHAGDKKLAHRKLVPGLAPTISVTSPAFADGGYMPLSATPPTLVVRGVPEAPGNGREPNSSGAWGRSPHRNARGVVLICEDPDAPLLEPFVHWLVYRLDGRVSNIDAAVVRAASEGKNSKLKIGWTPPAPPPGHGVHRYHFQVFALDAPLPGNSDEDAVSLPPYQPPDGVLAGVGRTELLEQMRGHVIAWGELVGLFER